MTGPLGGIGASPSLFANNYPGTKQPGAPEPLNVQGQVISAVSRGSFTLELRGLLGRKAGHQVPNLAFPVE